MQLGVSSYTFTWAIGVPGHLPARPMTAPDLLNRTAELGIGLVQVADNLPLDRLSRQALDALEAQAVSLGIAIEVGTRGMGLDHLRVNLNLAQRFRSPILRIVIDTASHRPEEDEVVGVLREFIPDLERANIILAIENHDRFETRVLVRIMERLASDQIGICLDTANSFGALEGPEAVVDRLGPWVVNLHVKDFSVRRAGHMMGFIVEGRPAGQGQLKIPWLIDAIRRRGRDPNAILELWTPPESTLTETILKEAAWSVASVKYLQSVL
jgi:sugar phosphate isomerase/epimerase